MFNQFMKWLVPKLETWCEKHHKVFHITGKQGPEDVYLVRYFLFRTKYLSIYIHRFLRSDIDDPHDHPFDFLGYVVSGMYKETLYLRPWPKLDQAQLLVEHQGVRGEATWAFRPAETIHKVEVDKPRTLAEKYEAPLTFIVRGPLKREWNFWRLWDGGIQGTYLGKPESWHKYLGVEHHSRE